MSKRNFFLVVAMLFCCDSIIAEEVVLVDRPIPESEAKYFDTITREEKAQDPSLERLKHLCRHITESPRTVRFSVVCDEEGKPLVMRITTRRVKSSATIYQADLAKEDLDRYQLVLTSGPDLPKEMTIDEIQASYGKGYWEKEWGIQRVEVFFNGALNGQYDKEPHLRVYCLDPHPLKTEVEKKQEQEWIEMAKQKLALGKDTAGLEHLDTECQFVERWWVVERDGPIPYGRIEERFENRQGREVIVQIDQWEGDAVPEHEFLRLIMEHAAIWGADVFKPKKLDVGQALVNETAGTVRVAYVSGNCTVYIKSEGSSAKELGKLYGEKLPSTLPKAIDTDKTKWLRADVEMILARLKDLVPLGKPTPIDVFSWNFNNLLQKVHLPEFRLGVAEKASVEKKQELYGKVAAWWLENKDKIIWSKEVRKLAVKQE